MNCILTDKKISYQNNGNTISYDLEIANNQVEIFICNSCRDKIKSNYPPYIIQGLIANNRWPKRSFIISKICDNKIPPVDSERIIIEDFLETASYPKRPSEKMEQLFLNLFKLQTIDGKRFQLNYGEEIFLLKNYFQNPEECLFYLEGLMEKGFINYHTKGLPINFLSIRITHLGLNKAIELLEEGKNSNNCFIAMAFTEEMKLYREAIQRALIFTGFNPVIIDETHLDSDKTIPDGILSAIRKSKFCVADFTQHRNGVYFESGYALGLGKPVIYLCREDEFEKAHFDIKQLQHIIYKTPGQLENKLKEKIEAWIKI